jgi:hypothetical protein
LCPVGNSGHVVEKRVGGVGRHRPGDDESH